MKKLQRKSIGLLVAMTLTIFSLQAPVSKVIKDFVQYAHGNGGDNPSIFNYKQS
jgi:hypothetical protein